MLALHANAPVSVDRLIDGLWGERPPATAPKLVQVMVSQLRKQLVGADAEIVTRGRGYELRLDPDGVDALLFERLLRQGEGGPWVWEALELWRGPPLDDLANEPFAAPEIRRLEELWLGARVAAIDAVLAEGRPSDALHEVDELLREHPLHEPLHAQRMLALYRCGRQAEALEAFRDARQALLDEVGLEPGPELRRLNDAILRQDADLDGPAPARRLVHRPRRSRVLLVAAAVAVTTAVGLAVAEMGGSSGLDRISEDSAGAIDPGSGRITAQYAVGHAPSALAVGAGSVWSANGRDGIVSRVDRNRQVTIDVGGEPTALAFGRGSLWVTDGENGRVDQINPAKNGPAHRVPTGNAPRGIAVTNDALWVTSAVDGQVDRIPLTPAGRDHRIDVPGGPAAIAAGEGAVWVAGEENGLVTKLDPRSGARLQPIRVGNAPAALAVGFGGVWVANRDDGTVMRIDTATDKVSATVTVGGAPVAVVAGLGAIWVADGEGKVIRIDPGTHNVTRRIAIGSAPSALALGGGSVWAATTASRASHRGGTLRYELAPEGGVLQCVCIDPAEPFADSWPVLSLAYDGLVSFRRVPGVGGATVVADLAESVPQPDDDELTYTFQLRPGLRFSDGTPVRPTDFRESIERAIRIDGPEFLDSIAGVAACTPKRCDLSAGIETDDAARTIIIHLRRPDPELLEDLALPGAAVLPSSAPAKLRRRDPAPGTGPYMITAFAPGREIQLRRNPRFRSGSSQTRPDGFPDAVTVGISQNGPGQVRAVERGRSDAVVFAGDYGGIERLADAGAIAFADASRVHAGPAPTNSYLFLNTRERPFDDLGVRQAVNLAIDRRRVVALAGGSGLEALSCQILPSGLPGYVPRCPYTRDPTTGGAWSAPDRVRARRLIAASGTRGERVDVWSPPRYAPVLRYAGEVLQRLGYHVRVHVLKLADYYPFINDTRHHAQVMFFNWSGGLTAASFFDSFSCTHLILGSPENWNPSRFCDPSLDAGVAAALAAKGTDANARWADLDRRLLDASPAVPLFNRRMVLLVSDRVGNAQLHQVTGPLLDQFWVR